MCCRACTGTSIRARDGGLLTSCHEYRNWLDIFNLFTISFPSSQCQSRCKSPVTGPGCKTTPFKWPMQDILVLWHSTWLYSQDFPPPPLPPAPRASVIEPWNMHDQSMRDTSIERQKLVSCANSSSLCEFKLAASKDLFAPLSPGHEEGVTLWKPHSVSNRLSTWEQHWYL